METTIMEILDAREMRVQRQRELLREYPMTLLCFTLNIPGPDKTRELAEKGFALGNRLLRECLSKEKICHYEQRCTAAGWESFYAVDLPAQALKSITVALEDKTPAGRVFDMDVLSSGGEKVTREDLGLPSRKCLLCDQNAAVCGRSRTHSVTQLLEKTDAFLQDGISQYLGDLALRSILCELYATPKPGLVDQNTGMVVQTPNMPFRNTKFRELFQKQWNIPVYLGRSPLPRNRRRETDKYVGSTFRRHPGGHGSDTDPWPHVR